MKNRQEPLGASNILPSGSAAKQSAALIIDDSRMQRRILSVTLKKLGYSVHEAASGVAALALCDDIDFDVILSDWMMPEMSGPQFCEAFRSSGSGGYSYIILLTSKSDKDDIAFGLESGADDFLTKPVNTGELRARIAAGQRIVEMQSELRHKNDEISSALGEIQRLYDMLDGDLQEAKKLQLSLLPERRAQFGQVQIELALQSSGHVGGDLVGYFQISEGTIGFFSLDVSGHGISSALMTSRLASYLSGGDPTRNVAITQSERGQKAAQDPAFVVQQLNDLMFSESDTDHYFTVLYGHVNIQTGRIRFCQAGHPHPVVLRADNTSELLGAGGLPVGLIENARYETCSLTLGSGDRFITVSDGFTEAVLPDGTMLEEQGLLDLLKSTNPNDRNEVLETLIWRLAQLTGKDEFDDDVSALLLGYS